MLRCGQMVMAQALIIKHLGRNWRWRSHKSLGSGLEKQDIIEDDLYWTILRQFLDKKSSLYSIHQIAQMGASEGKPVGEWFGPNTIAQTLR
jgi:cysteine protease ATG4D